MFKSSGVPGNGGGETNANENRHNVLDELHEAPEHGDNISRNNVACVVRM